MIVIGIAALMSLVGLSPALGAFLAGVVLANSEFRHELEGDIEPFKGLLLGVFFIAVGASIDFALVAAQGGDGTVFVTGRRDRSPASVRGSLPTLYIAPEHYGRMYRLAAGLNVSVASNVVGGIPNSEGSNEMGSKNPPRLQYTWSGVLGSVS